MDAFGGEQRSASNVRINKDLRKQSKFALEEARRLYDSDAELPSMYTPISDERLGALDEIMATANESRITGIGTDEWEKVISGGYLPTEENPYLQEMIDRAVGSSMSAPTSGYASAGRFGSGAMAHAQASAGQGTAARLLYQDFARQRAEYMQERQNMMAALGQTGAVQQAQYGGAMMKGRVGMEYEQDVANQQAEELRQFQWPYAKLDQFQASLAGNPLMAETRGTQVATQPFQWGTALLGAVGSLFNPSASA